MRISIIGMAGVGKTYYASMLSRDTDYKLISCDDLIAEMLAKELASIGIKPNLESITSWRGQPYEKRYRKNEQLQIVNEQAVMERVCGELDNLLEENIVVDTSGSVIYANSYVLSKLKALTLIIYIKAGTEHVKNLFTDEIIWRRPLIWGNSFLKTEYETNENALKRCFVNLFQWRSKEYERWADVIISYETLKNNCKTAKQFLNLVEDKITESSQS